MCSIQKSYRQTSNERKLTTQFLKKLGCVLTLSFYDLITVAFDPGNVDGRCCPGHVIALQGLVQLTPDPVVGVRVVAVKVNTDVDAGMARVRVTEPLQAVSWEREADCKNHILNL